MSNASIPLISIGVPVYNEARFLLQSLEALIHQDYPSIEIIISDNASSDETEKICREFAERYDKVNYHRYDDNLGPARNFSYVLQAATGKYFMWAAGHDLWARNYLSACVEILESHPKAIIAYGSSQWINEYEKTFGREYGWVDTRGMNIIARYFTVFWGNMHPILGVIRREALDDCPLINMVGADLIILSYLALKGDFIHAVKTSWSRREFRIEENYGQKLKRYKSKDYNLASTLFNKMFPLFRIPVELIKVLMKANLTLSERLYLLFLLIPSFPIRYIASKRK